jgi:hypothetical protein
MSPKLEITGECPYSVCEQHYSLGRGTLRRTYICKHPDREDCWCVTDTFVDDTCQLLLEEDDRITSIKQY